MTGISSPHDSMLRLHKHQGVTDERSYDRRYQSWEASARRGKVTIDAFEQLTHPVGRQEEL
jgi:hypothetical protein